MLRCWRLVSNRNGTVAVEFALVAPVLFALAFGIAKFGIVFNNYIMLTEAASTGARQLALSRGKTTPRTDTTTLITSAASGLTMAQVTITTNINGAACSTDTTCASAITAAIAGTTTPSASVTLSYPCDLVIFGVDFAPGCSLSSTRAQRIE